MGTLVRASKTGEHLAMAKKPIEEHLADFLMTQKGPWLQDYRRRCLAYWKDYYGEQVAMRVEAIVRERWGAKGVAGK